MFKCIKIYCSLIIISKSLFWYVSTYTDNGEDINLIYVYFTLNLTSIPVLLTSQSAHSPKMMLMPARYMSCCNNQVFYTYSVMIETEVKV